MAGDPYTLDGDSIAKLRADHQQLAAQFRNTQLTLSQLLAVSPGSPPVTRLRFRNDSGLTIPAWACMKITDVYKFQGIAGIVVIQPDGALAVRYALNGPEAIAPGGQGWAVVYGEARGINASAPPAAGQRYGPTANSWELTADAYPPIFTADGTAEGSNILGKLETSLNLIWHVVIGSAVAPGGLTIITLPDGRTVSATNWSNTTFNTADKAECYQDQTNNSFYLGGGGTGSNPDQMAIVNVYSATPTGNCIWAGKIAVPNTSNAYCSNQFPNGGACWLTVLNQNLGSTSTPKPDLNVGESFIGRHVGDFDNGDGTFTPIYGIYIGENEIYAVTIPSPGVGAGLTIGITLPDGRTITAINWSANAMSTSDKASVYHDKENKAWYLIKSGGTGVLRVLGQVNQTPGFYPADATVTVDTISTFDGSAAPAITTATNLLDLAGNDNDVVILEERIASADWIVAEVVSKFRRRIGALINKAAGLACTDPTATVDSLSTFDGSTAPSITTADNPLCLQGKDNDVVILEEDTSASPSTWFVAEIQAHPAPIVFRAKINQSVLLPTNTTCTITNVTSLTSEAAPTPTTAGNKLGLTGLSGDVCYIVQNVSSGGSITYEIISTTGFGKFLAKLTSSLSQGGSATADIWTGTPNSETDSTVSISVYDWLMKSGATAIASGKKIIVGCINGNLYVIDAECP